MYSETCPYILIIASLRLKSCIYCGSICWRTSYALLIDAQRTTSCSIKALVVGMYLFEITEATYIAACQCYQMHEVRVKTEIIAC